MNTMTFKKGNFVVRILDWNEHQVYVSAGQNSYYENKNNLDELLSTMEELGYKKEE